MRFLLGLVVGFAVVSICTTCDLDVAPIGCYEDNGAIPILPWKLSVQRSDYLTDGIFRCECARKAEEEGCVYFAIKNGDLCTCSTPASMTYMKNGKCPDDVAKDDKAIEVYKFTRCKVNQFKPVGCFVDKEDDRAIPGYTLNWRDQTSPSWDGIIFEWNQWSEYLYLLVCRCAFKAKAKGHTVFAIQYYGECWSGTTEESKYAKHGESTDCINYNFKACNGARYCAGKQWSNYVYKLDTPESSDVPAIFTNTRRESDLVSDFPSFARWLESKRNSRYH